MRLLVLATLGFLIGAPQRVQSQDFGCVAAHKLVIPRNPREGSDGRFLPGQVLLQRSIQINPQTMVKVLESPSSGRDLDEYNSTIVVERGPIKDRYRVRDLIKYGELLRIVEYAIACPTPEESTLLLGFETCCTGQAEGFVVLRIGTSSSEVWALPMANEGRIVVNRSDPSTVELWSANRSDLSLCEACPKHYVVSDCRQNKASSTCAPHPRRTTPIDPDKFMEHRIELR